MDLVELTFVIALAGLLVGIAVYFALRQTQTLRQLRHDPELSIEDRRYLYRQVVRRLVGSALLLVLAAFLIGCVFLLEPGLESLRPANPDAEVPQSAKDSLRPWALYVIGGLLVLLMLMILAVYDLFATARFGARHHRQLEDDRRAVLQAEVERFRRDRHGLNGHGAR
jgi:hypothetical protein